MPNKDNKIKFLQQKQIVVDPPPHIIAKTDTGATAHYVTQADAHALLDVQPTKMSP